MNFLIFDIESTGLPKEEKDPFHYPEYWPRMVQIAWVLTDGETVRVRENHYVKPEGFVIPQSAIEVHGITNEKAQSEGKPIMDVLSVFSESVALADVLVGHNVSFDRSIVTSEFARAKQNAPILKLPYHCTMKGSTEVCKLPPKGGRRGYKWPSLSELHHHLFESDFEDAHDALADVDACMRCYLELRKQGLFQELWMKPETKEMKWKKKRFNPYY